jgi:O-antigen ligase
MASRTSQIKNDQLHAQGPSGLWASRFETGAFWLLIVLVAWAPFPLGSNRPWAWTLLVLGVVAATISWVAAKWNQPGRALARFRPLAGPVALGSLALVWGLVQIAPWVPSSWAHPVWPIAADALGHPLPATISINPWRTGTELMKLAAYGVVVLLTAQLARRAERAAILLGALVAIGAFYGAYTLGLGLAQTSQYQLLYPSVAYGTGFITGPFVLHNSFATFMGLLALCALAKLFSQGSETIMVGRGPRQFFLTLVQFVFGRGAWLIVAILLIVTMLIVTASRAGTLASLVGLIALLVLSSMIATKRSATRWAYVGILAIGLITIVLFLVNGDTLQERFSQLVEAGGIDEIRQALWASAQHMIGDAPWLGLGLGTFENAYPMYADQVYPFVMDKVHNDYLELAAGWGLPATIAWISAMGWCAFLCVRGVFVRRRHRIYPLVAAGATALVAFHSAFDFSLQIPAVALTYAVILGLGLAQAFPTRNV